MNQGSMLDKKILTLSILLIVNKPRVLLPGSVPTLSIPDITHVSRNLGEFNNEQRGMVNGKFCFLKSLMF